MLSDGLDSYVIEGVQHNARLVNAVLRHPSFRAGDTPTSFLKTHISDFNDYLEELLTDSEEEELAVAVALISKSRENIFGRPPVVGSSVNDGSGKTVVVVRLDGLFGNGDAFSVTLVEGGHKSNTAYVSRLKDNGDIDDNENEKRAVIIDSLHFDMEYYLAHVTLDGTDRTIQVRTVYEGAKIQKKQKRQSFLRDLLFELNSFVPSFLHSFRKADQYCILTGSFDLFCFVLFCFVFILFYF